MSSKPQKDMDVESASLSSLSVTEKFKARWYVIFSALGTVAGLLGFSIHIGLAYQPGINPPNQWPAVWGAIFSAFFAAFLTFYLWQGKFYSRNEGARITKLVLWGFLAAAGFIIFICNMIVRDIGAIAGGIWALLWCGWAIGLFIGFLRTPTKRRPHRPKNNTAIKVVYGIIRVLAYLLLAVATFLIALMLGHVSSLAAETVALPVPGKLIQVNAGFPAGSSMNMHIYCKGPTDSTFPTIVLPSGGGTCSASMMPLQDALIDKYRACVFDSPGYCWSDTGKVPYVRSEQTDLVAQMLERSGEKGPFIMMGHSDGGQLSRALYVRHPELVAGIVLLDSVNTQWYTVTFNLTGQNFLADASNVGLVSTVDTVRAFAAVGVQRLFQRPNDFPAQYQLAVGWTWWQTRNWNSQYWGVRGGNGEFAKNWDYNVAGSYGDVPLLVLSASSFLPNTPCSEYDMPEGADCNLRREVNDAIFRDVVEGQRDLSTRGGLQVCFEDNRPCGHGFAFTHVDWIVEQFEAYFNTITFN